MKLDDPNKVFAIYIGDDTTDEDAFSVLKNEKFGVGILVATEKDKLKNTSAEFYLNDTNEVPVFLSKYSEFIQQK
jgi:trehalose 6-phosphate phosphatase